MKLELVHAILEQFPEADAVAGVATGAIAQGALVADELNLPFVYVRSKPKDHGMQNLIEGELDPKAKVVVVEDLISTGGSSLKAVEALRKNGNEIVGMVASYTYGFPVAEKAFADANVKLVTLTDYEHVVEEALETGYIKADAVAGVATGAIAQGALVAEEDADAKSYSTSGARIQLTGRSNFLPINNEYKYIRK